MISSLLVSEVMAVCWLEQSEFLVKGTISAFTPCLDVKYFFRASPQFANSLDSLYNCTNIPQVQRRSRGGHRQAERLEEGWVWPLGQQKHIVQASCKTTFRCFPLRDREEGQNLFVSSPYSQWNFKLIVQVIIPSSSYIQDQILLKLYQCLVTWIRTWIFSH